MNRSSRKSDLTLSTLARLANTWVPRAAGWDHLLGEEDGWGPAHELGHALIEPKARRSKEGYGRCAAGFCIHDGEECDVYEVAAMLISSTTLSN